LPKELSFWLDGMGIKGSLFPVVETIVHDRSSHLIQLLAIKIWI